MPADFEKAVIVTGLVRNGELLQRCLAPFAALLKRGVVDRVVYCTWAEEAAAHAQLLSALQGQGVQLVTPPDPGPDMPDLGGGAFTSVYYQNVGIRAALTALSAPEAVVLKARSDLIMSEAFAARLFEEYPRQQGLAERFHFPGVDWEWPLVDILRGRLWIPWVDLSLPFMMADECFMGFGANIEALCG